MKKENIKDQVEQAVTKLKEEVESLAGREKMHDVHLKAHAAAKPEEIEKFEKYLGVALPASYRAFLELHNGYDYLVYPGSMLSIASMMPAGELHNKIETWRKSALDYGNDDVKSAIVIAKLGQPNDWVYLNPNKQKDGEMVVVEFSAGQTTKHSSLIAFFHATQKFCKDYKSVTFPWAKQQK